MGRRPLTDKGGDAIRPRHTGYRARRPGADLADSALDLVGRKAT